MPYEYWVVNGHRPDCSYIRSLDECNFDGEEPCDCEPDGDDEEEGDDAGD